MPPGKKVLSLHVANSLRKCSSLQRPYDEQILTCDAVVEFCQENIPGITFFYVTSEQITECASKLEDRFGMAETIKGTQQYHRYVPVSKSTLHVYNLSSQAQPPALVHVSKSDGQEPSQAEDLEIKEQNFVCCMYDDFPWIGMVDDISEEFGDYHINFMHPHGPAKQFTWPGKHDACWVTRAQILCKIDPPSLTSSSSRNYIISESNTALISRVYPDWTV